MDRNTHSIVPSRDTPHPRRQHQQDAADYMRSQIAQVYDEPVANSQPKQPASQKNPYKHTYKTEAPFDWQNYHSAWQRYYQEYYQRYYTLALQQQPQQPAEEAQSQTEASPQQSTGVISGVNPEALEPPKPTSTRRAAVQQLQQNLRDRVGERSKKLSKSPHFAPIATALAVGLIFLCLQFNQVIAAQIKYFVSPGTLTNESSSIIIDPSATSASVGQEPRLVIPKINVDVPVVYDETSYDEAAIQKALEGGVVHYGNSALPGQNGNNVILGHSSNDMFTGGDYKFAFIRLDSLENGDVFILDYEGKRYVYRVFNKAVIDPSDFSLINTPVNKPITTLITCTPPGTTLKRLVVQGEQISPAPDSAQTASKPAQPQTTTPIPSGNAPSLLERIGNLF